MSDYKSNFEMKLAYHTAPSLYGIKASSLMKIKKDEYNEYLKGRTYTELSLSGIKIRIVYEDKNSVLVLVYNENLLEKHINIKCVNILIYMDINVVKAFRNALKNFHQE